MCRVCTHIHILHILTYIYIFDTCIHAVICTYMYAYMCNMCGNVLYSPPPHHHIVSPSFQRCLLPVSGVAVAELLPKLNNVNTSKFK